MNLENYALTYAGSVLRIRSKLDRFPKELINILEKTNGFIVHGGAFHLRGIVSRPKWHSLEEAMEGRHAFHKHYDQVKDTDIPFGQDCFGNQFLLRGKQVLRLCGETGAIKKLKVSFQDFIAQCLKSPQKHIELGYLEELPGPTKALKPGQLLAVFPPFCSEESASGVWIEPVPMAERFAFLVKLSKFVRSLPEGAKFKVGAVAT